MGLGSVWVYGQKSCKQGPWNIEAVLQSFFEIYTYQKAIDK